MATLSGANHYSSTNGIFILSGTVIPTTQNTMPNGDLIPVGSFYVYSNGTTSSLYQFSGGNWSVFTNGSTNIPALVAGQFLTNNGTILYWATVTYSAFIQLGSLAIIQSTYPTGSVTTLYLAQDTGFLYYWDGAAYQVVPPSATTSIQNKFRVISAYGTIATWYSDYQVALAAAASGDTLEMFGDAGISSGSIFKTGVKLIMNGNSLIVSGSLTTLTSVTQTILDYGIIRNTSGGTINISTFFALKAPLVYLQVGPVNGNLFTATTGGTQFYLDFAGNTSSAGGAIINVGTMTSTGNGIYVRGPKPEIDSQGAVCYGVLIRGVKINSTTININGDYTDDGTNGMFLFTDATSTGITVTARNYNGRIVCIDGIYYLQDLVNSTFVNAGAVNATTGLLYCRNIFNTSAIPAKSVFNMSIRSQDIYGNIDATLHDIYARYYFGAYALFTGVFYGGNGTYTPTASAISGNFTSATPSISKWTRNGNEITVKGRVSIVVATTGSYNFKLTIPFTGPTIDSNITGVLSYDSLGNLYTDGFVSMLDVDKVYISGSTSETTGLSIYYTYSYTLA